MSGGLRKRGFGDDFPLAGENENTKMRKQDGQPLRDIESFDSIADVTSALLSIERYAGVLESDIRQIRQKLEKSDILVRRRQGQYTPVPERRILYMEDITELRKLLDEHVGKSAKAAFEKRLERMEADDRLIYRKSNHRELRKLLDEHVVKSVRAAFEERLRKMVDDDRLIRKQTNHREVSIRVSEHADIPQQYESLPQELQPSRANELSVAAIHHRSPRGFRDPYPTANTSIRTELKSSPASEPPEIPAGIRHRCTADLELLKCIAWGSSDKVAAENILRLRKLRLRGLAVKFNDDSVELELKGNGVGNDSTGINVGGFQYGTKVKLVDLVYLLRLFNVITKFYDVAEAWIVLKCGGYNSGITFDLLKQEFGTPPIEQMDKIQIDHIVIESPGNMIFLRWFRTRRAAICDPEALVNDPSLISGVRLIEFKKLNTVAVNADRFLESVASAEMDVRGIYIWSKESIRRVLTAHMLSARTGRARKIEFRNHRDDSVGIREWKGLFESWKSAYEARHDKIGGRVTMDQRILAKNEQYLVTLELK